MPVPEFEVEHLEVEVFEEPQKTPQSKMRVRVRSTPPKEPAVHVGADADDDDGEDDADDVDDANSEDFDLDYSQTHLEDFLKSQTSNSLMKGSNI